MKDLYDKNLNTLKKKMEEDLKKWENLPCLVSDHYEVKVVFNSNRNNRKPTYTWKLNNTLLNDTLAKEEIRKGFNNILEFNENEGTTYPNL